MNAIDQLFGRKSPYLFEALRKSGRPVRSNDVNGVGIGYTRSEEQTLVLLLRRSVLHASSLARILSGGVGGFPIISHVAGEFVQFRAPRGTNRLGRSRPAPGGVSIGHHRITAGTLGCVVMGPDNRYYILSNNHVLANSNNTNLGEAVYQPGPADGGSKMDEIGRVANWIQLTARSANLVDAALAVPNNGSEVAVNILDVGRVNGIGRAQLGMNVMKSGRTTGLTNGTVVIMKAYVQVEYGMLGTLIFDDQIVIQPGTFSAPGDSGSLVVDNERNAIGLLFAGSPQFTLVNPIDHVIKSLGIRSIF